MTTELDRWRDQYRRNAASLAALRDRARRVAPRKYRGYTVAQLDAQVAQFAALAVASEADLRAHLAGVLDRCRAVVPAIAPHE